MSSSWSLKSASLFWSWATRDFFLSLLYVADLGDSAPLVVVAAVANGIAGIAGIPDISGIAGIAGIDDLTLSRNDLSLSRIDATSEHILL